jgi:hypothetical protein
MKTDLKNQNTHETFKNKTKINRQCAHQARTQIARRAVAVRRRNFRRHGPRLPGPAHVRPHQLLHNRVQRQRPRREVSSLSCSRARARARSLSSSSSHSLSLTHTYTHSLSLFSLSLSRSRSLSLSLALALGFRVQGSGFSGCATTTSVEDTKLSTNKQLSLSPGLQFPFWISVVVEGAPVNFLVDVALYSLQNEDQHS